MITHIQFLSGGLTVLVRALLVALYRVLFSFLACRVARQVPGAMTPDGAEPALTPRAHARIE